MEESIRQCEGIVDVFLQVLNETEETSNATGKAEGMKAHISEDASDGEFDQYAPFEEQIKYIVDPQNENKNIRQALLVGRTPKLWRDVGFSDLPITMSVTHTRENYFPKSTKYPDGKGMGKRLYQIPKKICEPIAIFASETHPEDSVVVLIELTNEKGDSVITPVEVNTSARNSGYLIDVNRIKTAFGNDKAINLLRKAVVHDLLGENTLFYWNKEKAIKLAHKNGVQFPAVVPNDGFVRIIAESKTLVNTKTLEQTDTKQFDRWFGRGKNNDFVVVPIRIDAKGKIGKYNNINTIFDLNDDEYEKDLLREGYAVYKKRRRHQ